jgi:phosphatidylglycerol:prolipoprotein diacylglycerol transferase
MMYVIGLVSAFFFLRMASKRGSLRLSHQQIESLMVYILLGMILGARLVYVLLYNFEYYALHPQEIFATWRGGLSFHGALLGICGAVIVYCRRHDKSFFNIMDHAAIITPVGLGLGRIGNFINGELWGRVTEAPIGMVFPNGGPLPRHPSQLYEATFEGLVLGIVMYFLFKAGYATRRPGVISGWFLVCYGTFRFFIEFFREPDSQLGAILGPFSMGQVLCAVMWAIGVAMISYALNAPQQPVSESPEMKKA